MSMSGLDLIFSFQALTISFVEMVRSQELLTLKGHPGCVHGVSFSPNGKVLVSGSADGTIRLWGDLTGTMR